MINKIGARAFYILSLVLLVFACSQTFAQENNYGKKEQAPAVEKTAAVDVTALESVIVMSNGRAMPMDSYARHLLTRFSGKSKINKQPAINWLARVFFTPHETLDEPLFMVNHPEVLMSVGVQQRDKRRYPFNDFQSKLAKLRELRQSIEGIEDKKRSPSENEILRLDNNIQTFLAHVSAFSFCLPNNAFTVVDENLIKAIGLTGKSGKRFTFLDIYRHSSKLAKIIGAINIDNFEKLTEFDKQAFFLARNLKEWNEAHHDIPPAFIPLTAHDQTTWVSGWGLLLNFMGNPNNATLVENLETMADAYRQSDQISFNMAVKKFSTTVNPTIPDSDAPSFPTLEVFTNKFDPFYKATIFYGFSFLLVLISFLGTKPWVGKLSFVLLLVGLLLQTYALTARMLIMQRPPVTNLYSTFTWVSWVGILLCMFMHLGSKRYLGVLVGSVTGLILLLISNRYALDGDTMDVMRAVLDSNFWLSTHVITITMGYAGCFVAGIVGHVYVFQALINPSSPDLKNTARVNYAIIAFGLIFSFVGTILGGIWADQSWGRFWGWDPKENGALLIVLWCAILLHARFDGMIRHFGFAIGSILGIIVVMLAWFGVNILEVGLHSYGFTEGGKQILLGYIGLQIVFVCIVSMIYYSKKNKALST